MPRDQPRAAVEAIQGALALSPDNADYLSAAATLATWEGDDALAARSYLVRLQELGARASTFALNLALCERVGRSNQPGRERLPALSRRPSRTAARHVRLELALALQRPRRWEAHHDRFRRISAYSQELAAIRGGAAVSRAEAVKRHRFRCSNRTHPVTASYVIRTMATEHAPRETFESLDSVRRDPSARETRTAEDCAVTLAGSTVEPGFSFYSDSDWLRVTRISLLRSRRCVATRNAIVCRLRAPIARRAGTRRPRSLRRRLRAVHDGWMAVAQKIGRVTIQGLVQFRDGRNPQADAVRGQCASSNFQTR